MKSAFGKMYNGFHWVYETDKGDSLSIILHDGSYGREPDDVFITPISSPYTD